MWWWKYVCCIVFLSLHQVSGKYGCYMREKNISCTDLREDDLHANMTVSLSKESTNTIEELKILDSSFFTIKREMFKNFRNLQTLYFQSTLVNYVDENAFADLANLKKLYLTDNYVAKINTNMFPVNNTVHTLDLSQNLLSDLSDFDISAFPSLALLNISHNKLEYLPENLVHKLKEQNKFYIIIDNNPWNCAHPAWNRHLTTILVEAFCKNNNYNLRLVNEKLERLDSGYLTVENETRTAAICTTKCALQNCVLWMVGSLWIGIIVGNMCKIKRLLFTTPTRFEDKTTQCDKLEVMSRQ